MAVVVDRVMNMVRDEIERRPDVTSHELFDKAKKLDRTIRSLSPRQFNATYPLQVRRSMAPPRPRRRGRRPATSREHVRSVLVDFARTVAGANDRGVLVDMIANIDSWVDRITEGETAPAVKRGRRRAA